MRRTLVLVAVLAAAAACDGGDDGEGFEATLTGAAETPPVTTSASGTSTIIIDGDETSYRVEVQGVNNATAAHIHAGAPGVAGPPVVFLFQTSTPLTVQNGLLATGTFDATDMIPSANISYDSLLSLIRRGNAYVNVHTTLRPPGEIRGQLARD